MSTIIVVVLVVLGLAGITQAVVRLRAARRRPRLPELVGRPSAELDLARLRPRETTASDPLLDKVRFVSELRHAAVALVEFIESRPPDLRASALAIISGMVEKLEGTGFDPSGLDAYRTLRAALEAVGSRQPQPSRLRIVAEED